MGLMWVELVSSFPQVLVCQLPPPSYPGLAPQEQFPGMIYKDPNLISYICAFPVGLGTATPTTSSSGNLLTTTAAGGDPAIFLGPYMLRFVPRCSHGRPDVIYLDFRSATVISRSSGHPGLYYGF